MQRIKCRYTYWLCIQFLWEKSVIFTLSIRDIWDIHIRYIKLCRKERRAEKSTWVGNQHTLSHLYVLRQFLPLLRSPSLDLREALLPLTTCVLTFIYNSNCATECLSASTFGKNDTCRYSVWNIVETQ